MGNKNFIKEAIALGKLPYVDKIQLRGQNAAISNSAETVWTPGATYAQLTAVAAMEAVSSSANDAAAGTGARTILIKGLSSTYAAISETITLNGATPVPLVGSYLAINSVEVVTAGSGLTNAGNIDVRVISGAVVKARIATTYVGQSADFSYTIPNDFIGLLSSISFSATGVTGDLTCSLLTHDENGITKQQGVGKSSLYVTAFNGAIGSIDFQSGLLIPEKTHLELRALVSAGAGDLVAQAELLLFDVKNNGLF